MQLEVADVFRKYGEDYRKQHGSGMSLDQHRAMRAIEICRTAALGGHIDECDECAHQVISYNSCRNRSCPKCQGLAKAKWLQARKAELLPVEYFHIVFTLPNLLAPLAYQNKEVIHNILFKATAKTLLTIGADSKHLGAEIGFLAILHTWGQNLMYHPHLHCVVPGGGLSPDGKEWIPCRSGFFLPVRVLSRLFRNLFLKYLRKAFKKGKLHFSNNIIDLATPKEFELLLTECQKTDWVVYSKRPFAGPDSVLDYLGRYTHRIAISNNRLLNMEDGKVTFTWKNYKKKGKRQIMTLEADEFIRRFLIHVPPSGFVRIRYYGFLANRHRKDKLKLCRTNLGEPEVIEKNETEAKDWGDHLQSLTGKDPFACPNCGKGRLNLKEDLKPIPFPMRPRAPP